MIASSEPAFRRAGANSRPCEWFRGFSYRAPALASEWWSRFPLPCLRAICLSLHALRAHCAALQLSPRLVHEWPVPLLPCPLSARPASHAYAEPPSFSPRSPSPPAATLIQDFQSAPKYAPTARPRRSHST